MDKQYDLIVIGAGSGGLTAANFAARLGVKVALIEKNQVGGDCTWSGCVPSKALLKVAKVAHTTRKAEEYGIGVGTEVQVDMVKVRDYIHNRIAAIYQHETPQQLTDKGIEVIKGAARFIDAHTIQVGEQTLHSKKFIIATGAFPFVPPIPGLQEVPYLTYLDIFDNVDLPERLMVIGAGPIGAELAQAYQRLGSQVTLIDIGLLPQEEPEVAEVLAQVFAGEGLKFIKGLVSAVRQEGPEIVLEVNEQVHLGDMLLVAVGRVPRVQELDLDKAGVIYSGKGVPVNTYLQSNVKHIYAVGDCVAGNYQFTHYAGWQGFVATRNALLPLNNTGDCEVMAWTTFTDPEVAHTGQSEVEARQNLGDKVRVTQWSLDRVDRAVVENDRAGFIKVIYQQNGKLLGATIVAERAGELITEFTLAIEQGLKLKDLAYIMHVYPSYAMGIMRLAAEVSTDQVMDTFSGTILRKLAGG